jgi:hypothetical protein
MKKLTFTFAVLIAVLAVPALGAQDMDFYNQQFDSMDKVQDQLGIAQEVAASNPEGAGVFYAHALDALLTKYPRISANNERDNADELAKLLCQKLGDTGDAGTGLNLWRVVESFSNPLVKAEALRALGKVQATDLLPQVVQLLTDLNNPPSPNERGGREQTAYGAIEGLEAYKDSSGYIPVFLASTGWYSERVKDRARLALPKIIDNPSDPLISIIKSSSYSYGVKYQALQVLEASDITAQQKAAGAVAALTDVWNSSTNVSGQRATLAQNRKLALGMIRRYGTEDANVYRLLERCYKEGYDEEEQISALAVLSALASDDSVRLLASFLADMTARMRSGVLTREDERLIRVIIPALGNTGKPSARNPLQTVLNNDWTSAVKVLARDALKKIQ